jgi:hypothetical protein
MTLVDVTIPVVPVADVRATTVAGDVLQHLGLALSEEVSPLDP